MVQAISAASSQGAFYSRWQVDRIRRAVLQDQALQPFVHVDADYRVQPSLVAMYDFNDDPISGQFRSVIFDTEKGIVLSVKTTRQLMNDLAQNRLLNFSHMRLIAKRLGFQSHHTLYCGDQLYMATHGVHHRNTDWLSLRYLAQGEPAYQLCMQGYLQVQKMLRARQIRFYFAVPAQRAHRFISESVTIGCFCDLYLQDLLQDFGYAVKSGQCVKRNTDYVQLQRLQQVRRNCTIKQLSDAYHADQLTDYGMTMAKLMDLPWFSQDHQACLRMVKRPDLID